MVDDEDFDELNKRSWFKIKDGYAAAKINGKVIKMHRSILKVKDKEIIVDHINGDVVDNTRANLRRCTQQENHMNRKPTKNCSSKYKGVLQTKNGHWRSSIQKDRKQIHLGMFNSEIEAAITYNNSAVKIHGDFARLNDIPAEFENIIPKPIKNRLPYTGVWCLSNGKFKAIIRINGKRERIGTFSNPIEAAKAYDAKAKELHGSKAKLNFPDIIDDEVSLLYPELYEESVLNVVNEGSETI